MENKKDIGKAFREKLEHLNSMPNDSVWKAIEADLQKKKKRRFIFPFWMKSIGLLGLFSVVAILTWMTQRKDSSLTHPIITVAAGQGHEDESHKNKASENPNENDSPVKPRSDKAETAAGEKAKTAAENIGIADTDAKKGKRSLRSKSAKISSAAYQSHIKKIRKKNDAIANHASKKARNKTNVNGPEKVYKNSKEGSENHITSAVQQTDPTMAAGQTPDSKTINDTIAAENNVKKTDSLKKPKKKVPLEIPQDSTVVNGSEIQKIHIFVHGSPTYAQFISDRSPLDRSLDNNPKKSQIVLSYGAYAIYEVSEKWNLRFGINIENLRFITEDALTNTSNYTNINYSKNLSNEAIYSLSGNSKTMNIIQDISYTEIPLELVYNVRNEKFGITAFAGLSYRFLGKNEVSVKTANALKFEIGETKYLSSNTFSINAGIGFYYKFSPYVRFNAEPVFKYHLLDYSHNRVTPYSIGILTGLQFSLKK